MVAGKIVSLLRHVTLNWNFFDTKFDFKKISNQLEIQYSCIKHAFLIGFVFMILLVLNSICYKFVCFKWL